MKEREFTVKERRETPLLFMSYQSLLHLNLYNLPWFPGVKVAPSLLNRNLTSREWKNHIFLYCREEKQLALVQEKS